MLCTAKRIIFTYDEAECLLMISPHVMPTASSTTELDAIRNAIMPIITQFSDTDASKFLK